MRTVAYTIDQMQQQLIHGLQGKDLTPLQRKSGVKDQIILHRIKNKLTDESTLTMGRNPMFELQFFDPHLDFPVEPLHTVLLGVIKYGWTVTCMAVGPGQKMTTFESRLASVDIDGLSIEPIRAQYIIQYRGGPYRRPNPLAGLQSGHTVVIVKLNPFE